MSKKQWKITSFTKEKGAWNWMGFHDEIQTEEAAVEFMNGLEKKHQDDPEFCAFVVDLENLDGEIVGETADEVPEGEIRANPDNGPNFARSYE